MDVGRGFVEGAADLTKAGDGDGRTTRSGVVYPS